MESKYALVAIAALGGVILLYEAYKNNTQPLNQQGSGGSGGSGTTGTTPPPPPPAPSSGPSIMWVGSNVTGTGFTPGGTASFFVEFPGTSTFIAGGNFQVYSDGSVHGGAGGGAGFSIYLIDNTTGAQSNTAMWSG